MRHIHTSIVSRHLAARGNNRILHHTLAAPKRYSPASLVTTLPNSEQINHPSSKYTCTKSMLKHIHYQYAPSVTLTHTTHIISSTALAYAPHCHPLLILILLHIPSGIHRLNTGPVQAELLEKMRARDDLGSRDIFTRDPPSV